MIPLLSLDSPCHCIDFGAGDVPALDSLRAGIYRQQHITFANQVLGPSLIHNHLGIRLRLCLECNTHRKVRLNHSGNHFATRRLGSNNQMNTAGTPHLRKGDDGIHYAPGVSFPFRPAGAKDQLRVFIDNHHNIRQEVMPVLRVQLMSVPLV